MKEKRNWDYAELSKSAKEHGGPAELIQSIEEDAEAKGRAEMLPLLGVAVVVGAFIKWGLDCLRAFCRRKKEKLETEKQELINRINEYDGNLAEVDEQ